VAATLWLSATPPAADACPAGSPCLKYRRMNQTVQLQPEYFAREGGGSVPAFDRKKLTRYLATSKWKPVFDNELSPKAAPRPGTNPYYQVTYVKDSSKLHFVDPSGKIPNAGKDERVVLVRQMERDKEGDYFIDVDGIAYQLQYCVTAKGTVACLTSTGSAFNGMFPVGATNDSELERPTLKAMPF
jgi:hypothetical protein